jgi:hypothetical protein
VLRSTSNTTLNEKEPVIEKKKYEQNFVKETPVKRSFDKKSYKYKNSIKTDFAHSNGAG